MTCALYLNVYHHNYDLYCCFENPSHKRLLLWDALWIWLSSEWYLFLSCVHVYFIPTSSHCGSNSNRMPVEIWNMLSIMLLVHGYHMTDVDNVGGKITLNEMYFSFINKLKHRMIWQICSNFMQNCLKQCLRCVLSFTVFPWV